MKAAVIRGSHRIELEERLIPSVDKGEVLVRVRSVGICGSDVHGFLGLSGTRRLPGLVMGHEASGEVVEVGQGVKEWKRGDHVTIDPQQVCGQCYQCQRGWPNLCDNMSVIGSSMRNFKDGAMCEYIALSANQLYILPENMSFNEGAMLDPVGNAIHVFNRSQIEIGEIVAVIGTGAIGLILIQVARLMGAGKIIAVDTSGYRLNIAKNLGADILINPLKRDIVNSIMSETNGKGAGIVVEAVGLSKTYQDAVNSTRKRGKVLALGFMDSKVSIPIQSVLFREISLIGNTAFMFNEIQSFLDFVSRGRINLKPIITHEFPLEKVQEAFELLTNKSSSSAKAIKVIIKP